MTTHLEWKGPFGTDWHSRSWATGTRYSVGQYCDADSGSPFATLTINPPGGVGDVLHFGAVDEAKVAAECHHAERMRAL